MVCLIVDDEDSTREALRLILQEIGAKSILEAKDGIEALKYLEKQNPRVDVIISDWEMPHLTGAQLSDEVGKRPSLGLIPFLLITSEMTTQRKREMRDQHKRIDHLLMKPFRLRMLDEAIQEAYEKSLARREGLVWFGATIPEACHETLEKGRDRWPAFRQIRKTAGSMAAGVLIDTKAADLTAIETFRAMAVAKEIPWVVVGHKPAEVRPFRLMGQAYVAAETLKTADAWMALFEKMHGRLKNVWQIEALTLRAKTFMQEKLYLDATDAVSRLVDLDPFSVEGHLWMAEIFVADENVGKAEDHLRKAWDINPMHPKIYLEIFKILKGKELLYFVAQSAEYCLQNADVHLAAGKAIESSEPEYAKRLLDKSRTLKAK